MPDEVAPHGSPAPVSRARRRLLPLAVLTAGALLAAYLGGRAPRDQDVKLVLGAQADTVTGLEIQYIAADGDVAREARMSFELGRAPRVVAHQPRLSDGPYTLRIELLTRDVRRSVERRVTLGGGSTQVDLASVVAAPPASAGPEPRNAP